MYVKEIQDSTCTKLYRRKGEEEEWKRRGGGVDEEGGGVEERGGGEERRGGGEERRGGGEERRGRKRRGG